MFLREVKYTWDICILKISTTYLSPKQEPKILYLEKLVF